MSVSTLRYRLRHCRSKFILRSFEALLSKLDKDSDPNWETWIETILEFKISYDLTSREWDTILSLAQRKWSDVFCSRVIHTELLFSHKY
jgi:hypothetical protein